MHQFGMWATGPTTKATRPPKPHQLHTFPSDALGELLYIFTYQVNDVNYNLFYRPVMETMNRVVKFPRLLGEGEKNQQNSMFLIEVIIMVVNKHNMYFPLQSNISDPRTIDFNYRTVCLFKTVINNTIRIVYFKLLLFVCSGWQYN